MRTPHRWLILTLLLVATGAFAQSSAPVKEAQQLIVQGKADEALTRIDAALAAKDAAASAGPDELSLLKMNLLEMLGRNKEAEALAETLRTATDAETQRGAKAWLALGELRRGNMPAAAEALDAILKESRSPAVLAPATIYRGRVFLAQKEWETALLSFLQLPVLYADQPGYAPSAMLGVALAHFGLDDFQKARLALKELIKTYPGTPEAASAKEGLDAITKRERAQATAPK